MERDPRLDGYELPTLRTVENWFVQLRQEEQLEESWTLADTPQDAPMVLAHWKRAAEWAIAHDFPPPVITKTLAQRLIWVHQAAPDIPVGLAWIVANNYFDSPDKTYWHLLLATKPWQSEEANANFYRLAKALFGPPVGDNETADEYRQRYPLGVTPFHLFGR